MDSRWHHGLALEQTYRESLHLKVNYNDGISQSADLVVIKACNHVWSMLTVSRER